MQQLRLLSYNIQAGIYTRNYRDYLTQSWKHVLPHRGRMDNLARIGTLLHQYDLVGLQEVDAGSLRSAFVDQTEYLARQGNFFYWYKQVNRNLGSFAQHSNGLLSRVGPDRVTDYKLPGLPGRGAVIAEWSTSDGESLAVCVLHLALGWRARRRQLDYLHALATRYAYFVMMGDFNCGCGSKRFQSMVRASGLRGLDCEMKTFPSWRPTHNLDHILVSPSLRILSTKVIDYALSDHLPLSATIELPGRVRIAGGQGVTVESSEIVAGHQAAAVSTSRGRA